MSLPQPKYHQVVYVHGHKQSDTKHNNYGPSKIRYNSDIEFFHTHIQIVIRSYRLIVQLCINN